MMAFFHWLHENYGEVVRFRLPGRDHCALFSGDIAREMLVDKAEVLRIVHPRTSFEVCQADGLARMPAGAAQGRLAELVRASFSPERARVHAQVAAEEAALMAEGLTEGMVDIRRTAERFVWNVLATSVLGEGRELDLAVVAPAIRAVKLNFLLFSLPGYGLLRRLPLPQDLKARKAIRPLDAVANGAIEKARTSDVADASVISHLVWATESGESGWRFANDREIRDEAYVMMLRGMDTPIFALAHAPYHLGRDARVRRGIEEEVDRVVGDRPLSGEDLRRLSWTRSVCMEILRLYPPGALLPPREAMEDCTLGGFHIPKGTYVDLFIRVIHHRSDYWEDADMFRPERWLDGGEGPGEGPRDQCPRDRFMPFSIGPKECLGQGLAMDILVAGLAALSRRWRLAYDGEDFPLLPGLELGALNGAVPVTATPRTG